VTKLPVTALQQQPLPTKFPPRSDAYWQSIAAAKRSKMFNLQRRCRRDLRQVVNAIRHLTRTQWRNLPQCFPAWQSVYYYYRQWRDSGRLTKLLQALVGSRQQIEHKGCFVGLDTHKRVNGRKRHLAVDCLGLLVASHVLAVHCHDGQAGIELLPQLKACRPRLAFSCADSAYGGNFQPAADW